MGRPTRRRWWWWWWWWFVAGRHVVIISSRTCWRCWRMMMIIEVSWRRGWSWRYPIVCHSASILIPPSLSSGETGCIQPQQGASSWRFRWFYDMIVSTYIASIAWIVLYRRCASSSRGGKEDAIVDGLLKHRAGFFFLLWFWFACWYVSFFLESACWIDWIRWRFVIDVVDRLVAG